MAKAAAAPAEEITKTEMVHEVIKAKPDATVEEVIAEVKKKHKVELTESTASQYRQKARGELGLTKKREGGAKAKAPASPAADYALLFAVDAVISVYGNEAMKAAIGLLDKYDGPAIVAAMETLDKLRGAKAA